MRYTLTFVFIFSLIRTNGQPLFHYTDTLHHFSIDVPEKWKYETEREGVVFQASRIPHGRDTARDVVNVNIIETPRNLERTFAVYLKYISKTPNFQLIAKGDTTLNGMPFKWIVTLSSNLVNNKIPMQNYDLVTVKNGKTYILTMMTFPHTYIKRRPLFNRIANSFKFLD
ncbi:MULTISPECIES: hypothetical protein [Niastella]|uniref:PsbP C-terminal domain-containing protein n=1 Tax=Niastella soli TaxID=2821487 RepID=A0ABS3Z487_9BACT|nr:hypothetical protein [Niastella soli]MBO9204552.1 hypothetical protein [Niastella soli]